MARVASAVSLKSTKIVPAVRRADIKPAVKPALSAATPARVAQEAIKNARISAALVPAKKAPVAPVAAKRGAASPKKALTAEQRAQLRIHRAPADFRPAAVEITFTTAHDGMVSPKGLRIERVKGSLDNENAKRFDMFAYDPTTAAALIARLSAGVHATNALKRLPGNRTFFVAVRAGVTKDGDLTCSLKSLQVKGARDTWAELTRDSTGAAYDVFRKMRRTAVLLRGAFTECLLLPAGRAPKAAD